MKTEQRRRLTDLYARGKEVELDDGNGEPIRLWIRKMTPADAEVAYVKASARRAAFLAMGKEDPPSDAYIALRGEIEQFTPDNLVLWVTANEMVKREPVTTARIASAEEWTKDRYLDSLKERVEDEDFKRKVEEFPEDEEVVRVNKELARFQEQVDKEVEKERKRIERETSGLSQTELIDRVLQNMLESQADAAWLTEFSKCQIWRCVFDGDKRSQRCFENREEVDELYAETVQALVSVIEELHVTDMEGKDSQQTPDSSTESD